LLYLILVIFWMFPSSFPIIKLFSFSDMNPSAKKFFFFLLFLLRTCFNMSFRSDYFLFSFFKKKQSNQIFYKKIETELKPVQTDWF
jgi:hypothetical protein